MLVYFFFFKQKTAYEMRISDWSSDVCSSDLARSRTPYTDKWHRPECWRRREKRRRRRHGCGRRDRRSAARAAIRWSARRNRQWRLYRCARRSEEHTSELQSLMRISYAVFCLKKKTKKKTKQKSKKK